MKKLTKEKQIDVLENVLERIKEDTFVRGLCHYTRKSLLSVCHLSSVDINISNYIDGFNITNARRLASKYKFSRPDSVASGYWWDRFNFLSDGDEVEWYAPRIGFINALITELKQK